ncbi:MAG: DUF3240 family protein [Hyphomicrobium sp.]
MLRRDPPSSGFTTWIAEGHGLGFANASISERVRGRVKRAVLIAVLRRDELDHLVSEIAEAAPIPHVTYWIEPVEAFGHLAPANVRHGVAQSRTTSHADLEGTS